MEIEVSVVTPTYNRRQFIPTLIEIYKNQTFPKDKMEWIIVDDGRDKVEDIFNEFAKDIPNVRYIYIDEKMRLGAKRNFLNKEAKGKIIIAMDDDDYYPPDRVESVVKEFNRKKDVDVAGSSEMLLYFTDDKKIYSMGPFNPNHATNGTMAWRKKYSDTHKYNEFVTKAEELSFLDNYTNKMIQLPVKKTILVICHSDNTVDKFEMRQQHLAAGHNSKVKLTSYVLSDIVKNSTIREFYENL
jgi:glycosyltransferase involved in cell wall biosynthesis